MAQDLAQAYVQIIPTAKGMGKNLEGLLGDGAEQAGASSGKKIVAGIIGAFGAAKLGSAVTSFIKDSIGAGKEFDQAMAQVAATMGKNVSEIGDLRDFAQEMGSSTAFSATQAAEALNYMALAGYNSEQAMTALPNVLNLAAAGGIDLAYASDMVTDAQSALGLTFEESADMVDKMAMASSKSNTSVAQLGEAILTVGGTAKNLQGGTTELATILGVLADNGIKGAEGGTALRNVILSLSAPTDKAAEVMEELGINAFDANGNMKPLDVTFNELNGVLSKMTQKKRTEVLNTIFNKVDLKSVNALLGTSAERFDELAQAIDGSWYTAGSLNQVLEETGMSLGEMQDKLSALGIDEEAFTYALDRSGGSAEDFAESLHEFANSGVAMEDICAALGGSLDTLQTAFDSAAGAASRMANTQLDSLSGDMTILNSAMEGLKIEVFDQMKQPLRDAAEYATELVTTITQDLSDSEFISGFIADLQEKLPGVKSTVDDFAKALGDFASPVLELGKWLLDHPETITGVLAGIATTIVTYELISKAQTLASSFSSLLTAFTNPAWLGAFGVSLAIGAVVGVVAGVKAKNASDRANELAGHFGSVQLSLKDLKSAADAIVNNGTLGTLDEALASFTSSDSALSAMNDAVRELNKANWKISVGMKLTEEEQATYQANIEAFVENCQATVDENAYGVHLTLSLLIDETDTSMEGEIAAEAVKKVDAFYQGKQKELADLGKELNETVTKAFNDGLLDIDELAQIQEVQQQMANIQASLAGSTFAASLEGIGMGFSGINLTPESFQNLQDEVAKAAEQAGTAYREAFEHAVAALNVTFSSGESGMTQEEYDAALTSLKEGYLNNLAEIQLQAQQFSLNTIMEAYGDQIEGAVPGLITSVEEAMSAFGTAMSLDASTPYDTLVRAFEDVDSGLGRTVKENIASLLDNMIPTESLENIAAKAEELGVAVPEGASKGLTDVVLLQALTGDVDALLILMAEQLAGSEYENLINESIDGATEVPETFRKTIQEHSGDAKPAIDSMYQTTKEYLEAKFAAGFNVNTIIRVNATTTTTAPVSLPSGMGNDPRYRAEGGIITSPELSWIAEDGYTESIIPWDGSRRAFDLWMQTGEGIGALDAIRTNQSMANAVYGGSKSSDAVDSGVVSIIERIRSSVDQLSDRMSNLQIIMDSGVVAGELVDKLDSAYGQKLVYQSRRN